MGGGQQIPMIDTAVAFASHGGANSIIITTLSNSLHFHKASGTNNPAFSSPFLLGLESSKPSTSTSTCSLALPQTPPSYNNLSDNSSRISIPMLLSLMFHGWAADIIDELKSQGSSSTAVGVSSRCVFHNVTHYAPHQKLGSDSEPFELTRSQFPPFIRDPSQGGFDWRKKAM